MFTFNEIPKTRSHKYSPSRTWIRLFSRSYKRQDKAGECVSEVQPVLFDDCPYEDLLNNCLIAEE